MLIIRFIHLKSSKIYRCLIVWGHNIRIVIIPSILAFTFLGLVNPLFKFSFSQLIGYNLLFPATWLGSNGSTYFITDPLISTYWASKLILPSLGMSLIVNALVTSLIVFRIIKVFREVRPTSDQQIGGGSTLRYIIFVLIESGMAMFAIQLVRFVLTIVPTEFSCLPIIIGIHQMFNVIIKILRSFLTLYIYIYIYI